MTRVYVADQLLCTMAAKATQDTDEGIFTGALLVHHEGDPLQSDG